MDNTASCMIEVCDLHKHYKDVHVLRGISTTVAKGEVCAVIGPSGSGKSTFLRCLNRLEEASSGEIFINAQEITDPHLNLNKMRENIGMVFQGFNLFPHMTALENVMVGCQVRRKSQWWMPVFSLPSARREEEEIREKAKGLIHRLALDSYMNEKASSLPYGAQRRLEIARALATSPDFLLLDEPAAGMNPQESTELMRFIRHIRDEFDLTILLIEHDMKVVMGVCQYIWVLEYGQLIAEGDPDAIRNNPRVIEAYLGEDVSNHA